MLTDWPGSERERERERERESSLGTIHSNWGSRALPGRGHPRGLGVGLHSQRQGKSVGPGHSRGTRRVGQAWMAEEEID